VKADWLRRADRTFRGAAVELGLYVGSAIFAGFTAIKSTLPAHRPWGVIAAVGYGIAAVVVLFQLRTHHPRSRLRITLATWIAVCLVPLLIQAVQRARGHPNQVQEEVDVIERSGIRMLEHGTPFLSRDEIARLPEPLLGYTPYQPGMASFGLPRALLGAHWFTDARIWFAAVAALCMYLALRHAPLSPATIRALQAVTVLPIAALTLATGGDDLPVLALTLLGLTYLAQSREIAAGVALGLAAALKLFAWPVALVVLLTRWSPRLAIPLIAIPVLTALPAFVIDPHAFVENVFAFPFGHGLVTSPAASPLPGYLIATSVPGGRYIALALLGIAGCALACWLLLRPPRTAAAVSGVCAVGLLAATLLMPATRFGYLLYPIAYALWIPFLRGLSVDSTESDDEALPIAR
jgi:hypothetical protein